MAPASKSSSYILQYLELKYPETPLLPEDVDGRLEARRFEVLCDGVCDAVVLTFFESLRADQASPEWLARQRRKIEGGVREMSRLLGIDPSPSGRNSVSATSRSGPSSATFQSALPNLTGGAIIRILRCLAPAWRSAHRSPAPFQFRNRFRTKSYSKDAGADFWPGQRCRGCRRRPLASESDHHHLARRAPLPDAGVSPPRLAALMGPSTSASVVLIWPLSIIFESRDSKLCCASISSVWKIERVNMFSQCVDILFTLMRRSRMAPDRR